MLKFIHLRFKCRPKQFVTEEELKLFNLVKVLLDGGWVLEDSTLEQTLEICGVNQHRDHYLKNVRGEKDTNVYYNPPCTELFIL